MNDCTVLEHLFALVLVLGSIAGVAGTSVGGQVLQLLEHIAGAVERGLGQVHAPNLGKRLATPSRHKLGERDQTCLLENR